ncbi:MAG: ABC transporter ATP-binding protein [Bacteroidales bacterium]|jgi:ABC-2 type transport system ATP-binding protein|nr:ABC transporter ATP-binding protein [Bacteroidales bacterium]
MHSIETKNITKLFGRITALDNVSIQVNEGEIYGFIGLNGAGKTTLIRILLGMIRADSGNAYLFGKKLSSDFNLWNNIGYSVETPHAYPDLSVTDNLKVYYQLRHMKNPTLIDNIIDQLHLGNYADTKAKHLSLGNSQRLGLAKALMHRPKLLILDEPINGLDPEGIIEVRELLKELSFNGATVFLSSHILDEISKVANRIAIIHQGKLIEELTTEELTDKLIRKILIQTRDNRAAVQVLKEANHTAVLEDNGEIALTNSRAVENPENISELLVEKGLPPKQLYLFTEDLEMFFLRMIKYNNP